MFSKKIIANYQLREDVNDPQIIWCKVGKYEFPFLKDNIRSHRWEEKVLEYGYLVRDFTISINGNEVFI